jgi:hypothetical protein
VFEALGIGLAHGQSLDIGEVDALLQRGWGFESRNNGNGPELTGIHAKQLGQAERHSICSASGLKTLVLRDSNISHRDVNAYCTHLPNLTSVTICDTVNLSGSNVSPEVYERLLQHNALRNLELLRWSGAASLDSIATATTSQLQSLSLTGTLRGTLDRLLLPCDLQSLYIGLQGTRKGFLDDTDWQAINRQQSLTRLSIQGLQSSGSLHIDLGLLSNLTKLKELSLAYCTIEPRKLSHFPALEKLDLTASKFSGDTFNAVFQCPRLKVLTLADFSNSELGIEGTYEGGSGRLESISFQSPAIEDLMPFRKCAADIHLTFGSTLCLNGRCVALCHKENRLPELGQKEAETLQEICSLRSLTIRDTPRVSVDSLFWLVANSSIASLDVGDFRAIGKRASFRNTPRPSLRRLALLERWRIRKNSSLLLTHLLGPSIERLIISEPSSCELPTASEDWQNLQALGFFFADLRNSTPIVSALGCSSSVEHIVFERCKLNGASIQHVVAGYPALKRLTIWDSHLADERSLLRLDGLRGLQCVDLSDSSISAATALGIVGPTVLFGDIPRPLACCDTVLPRTEFSPPGASTRDQQWRVTY